MNGEGIYRMLKGVRTWQAGLPADAAQYDAIIVGGGTAGAIAAVVLSERHCRVLVVERLNSLGGMSTAGGISGYYYGSRGGLYEQLDAEAKAYEPLGYPASSANGFHAELKRRVLEKRILAAGGHIAFEADLTGVLMRGNRVLGVEYAQDDGLHAACAREIIDATAEAYVCLLAGASYEQGRALDQKVQPYGNVRLVLHDEAMRISHEYTDCGYVDPTVPEQYSEAVLSAAKFPCYLQEDYRQGPRLITMTQCVGMREGPLVEGDVRLRFEDVVDGTAKYGDILFTAYSNADNHGKDMAFENRAQRDWMIACSLWGLNFSVNVPVGAVIPKGLDGLLMAGRMISVDHDLASCIRMERDIQKCGEAVGLLAAEAISRKVDTREVSYAALEPELRRSGCLLDQNDVGFIDSRAGQGCVRFPQSIDEICSGLASTAPGMAMWRVRTMTDRMPLYDMLRQTGGHAAVHAAMALALAGDDAGAPILLECMRRQDPFVPDTSRKYNMIRGAAAIYLLGRLGYLPALKDMLDVVAHWKEIDTSHFKVDEFLGDAEEYRFQYLSQAIVAAMEIASQQPTVRLEVNDVIHGVIDAPDFSIFSTLKGRLQLKYQMAPMIRNAVRCLAESWGT